jgi:hypothetical protein
MAVILKGVLSGEDAALARDRVFFNVPDCFAHPNDCLVVPDDCLALSNECLVVPNFGLPLVCAVR